MRYLNPPRKRIFVALMCAMCMCAWSSVAVAQTAADKETEDNIIRLIAASTTTTTASFFIYGGMLVTERQNELQQDVDIMEQFVLIDAYIDDNDHGLRMAFTMGAGSEIGDIAVLMGHEGHIERDQLAALRTRRGELMAALDARASGSLEAASRVHAIFASTLRSASHEEVRR